MSNEIKIIGGTHDKFVSIPNFLLDTLNSDSLALYNHIKRFAGENGSCFATEETLCKKLKWKEKRLHSALNILIKEKLIEFIGLTRGKTRPIKTYKTIDIWSRNEDFYNK